MTDPLCGGTGSGQLGFALVVPMLAALNLKNGVPVGTLLP